MECLKDSRGAYRLPARCQGLELCDRVRVLLCSWITGHSGTA
jgi:hypothetical protein